MLLSWCSMHRPPMRSGRCAVARALSEGGVKRDGGAEVWSCAPDARLRASQAGHAAATIANWNGDTTDHDGYRMPQPARANSTSTASSASTMRVDIRWFFSSFLDPNEATQGGAAGHPGCTEPGRCGQYDVGMRQRSVR